jgi:subtilase family serine protease
VAKSSCSVTISFSGVAAATGPQDVQLTIKDYCNDMIIVGATCTLVSALYPTQTRTSDVNGQVTFPLVPVGDHSLTVTAAGYLDSAIDTLANDIVRV